MRSWTYSSFSVRQNAKLRAHRWEGESITDTVFRLMWHLKRAIASNNAPAFPSLINERPKLPQFYSEAEVAPLVAAISELTPQEVVTKRAIVWALEMPVQNPVTSANDLLELLYDEFLGKPCVPIQDFMSFVRAYTPVRKTGTFRSGLLGGLRSRGFISPVNGQSGVALVNIPFPEMPKVTASSVRRWLCLSPNTRAQEVAEFVNDLPAQVLKKDGAIAGVLYPAKLLPPGVKLTRRKVVDLSDYNLPKFGKIWREWNGEGEESLRRKEVVKLRLRSGQEVYYLSPEVYHVAIRQSRRSGQRIPA